MGLRGEVIAVVPARGGSTGFPGKNLAPFLGRPLVAHAVDTALAAAGVHTVLLSTDDDRIAEVGTSAGAELVRRPAALAGPASRSVDAVLHALGERNVPDSATVVLVQPTTPLRTPADIEECLAEYGKPGIGSVVQVTASDEHHPLKSCLLVDGRLTPVGDWPDLEAPRQSLPQVLRPTGGVYVVGAGALRSGQAFFVPEVRAQVVPGPRAIDVDTEADLHRAEAIAIELGRPVRAR